MDSITGEKRKRGQEDDLFSGTVQSSNVTQINYLIKTRREKMPLIEGDSETFKSILTLMDDYEGVLQRHESLAANLGAKLVGPLLVKSFEKLFEGPIKILQAKYGAEPTSITWLDVIDFAHANPNSFVLSDSLLSGRVCQFWVKQCLVEISEDDYRLVLSGAPERMIPKQPIAEDEVAEIATLDILEQRLSLLIRKADLVAGRARQLNYHLKGRKTAIQAERVARQPSEPPLPSTPGHQPSMTSSPFQPVNNRTSTNGEHQTTPLHQDLLRQFLVADPKSVPSRSKPKAPDPHTIPDPSKVAIPPDPNRRMSQQPQPTIEELSGGHYRPLMAAKNDKLARGDPIWPPCDRCRRLRMECTKYLTACTGCTKKHAKCTWNDITEEEVSYLVANAGPAPASSGGENNGPRAGSADAHSNANLDPGLRSSSGEMEMMGGSGAEHQQYHHQHPHQHQRKSKMYADRGDGRRNDAEDERRILSHMASSAAAAAGQ